MGLPGQAFRVVGEPLEQAAGRGDFVIELDQQPFFDHRYMTSAVSAGLMAIERTGLVTIARTPSANSIAKPTCTQRSFRKLPPSDAPARRAGVNSGKNDPPRTSTSADPVSVATISYVLCRVRTIRRSRGDN